MGGLYLLIDGKRACLRSIIWLNTYFSRQWLPIYLLQYLGTYLHIKLYIRGVVLNDTQPSI